MTKQIWLNLPVADVSRSRAFFNAIGFRENPRHAANPTLTSYQFGEHDTIVMLFEREEFQKFTQLPVTDTHTSSALLINLDADSEAEIHDLRDKVVAAGGNVYTEPGWVERFMYLFCFADPDGHRWCVTYFDMSKLG